MESSPLVSIVTPFYNTRELPRRVHRKRSASDLQNWDYVLVDNQQHGRVCEIAEHYVIPIPG